MLPYVVLSWATGRLADRFRRDRLVLATLVVRVLLLTAAAVDGGTGYGLASRRPRTHRQRDGGRRARRFAGGAVARLGLGVRAFVVLLAVTCMAGIAAVARTRPSAVLDAPTSGPPIPQQRRPVEPGQTLSASSGS